MLQFNFNAARQFLAYLDGQTSLGEVLDHPAYQIVARHAQMFGNGITVQDVENALAGKPSSFYGVDALIERLPRIMALLDLLEQSQADWGSVIEDELCMLSPDAGLDITLYPILGYDMGIGLNGVVCMNLNCVAYLDTPLEFLFYAIHECVHVLYERIHHIPSLAEVNTPAQWRSYFNLWTHNEGFAVYMPLHLREKLGGLDERDYRVLYDIHQLATHRLAYLAALERLRNENSVAREDYLEICFGDMRLTYRIGCELLQRVEHLHGVAAVQEAFLLDSNEFVEHYKHLLME